MSEFLPVGHGPAHEFGGDQEMEFDDEPTRPMLRSLGTGANQAAAGNHSNHEPFPVGSVFTAVVSTNPATLLGYGTWVAFATGRLLIGIDAGNADIDTVKETAGSLTQADHTGHGVHGTHATHATHVAHVVKQIDPIASGTGDYIFNTDEEAEHDAHGAHDAHTNNAAISAHGTNLPPVIVVYMWERTA